MKSLDPRNLSWLVASVREDYVANKRHWTKPGFQAVVVYRFGVWADNQTGLLEKIAGLLYMTLFVFVRNLYSIELPRFARVGRRLWIPHPVGIVVTYKAEIGDDCLIRQNVTIGLANGQRKRQLEAPRLGNGVEVGAGAVIAGGVTIGDNARIGPNAVVMTDVPPGGSASAAPARVMKPLIKDATDNSSSTAEN